jgi:hypothetical protein
LDFLSLKNDVNVPSKSNKQKNLKFTDDPDPHQNVMDPEHCNKGQEQRNVCLPPFRMQSRRKSLRLSWSLVSAWRRVRKLDASPASYFFFRGTIFCLNMQFSEDFFKNPRPVLILKDLRRIKKNATVKWARFNDEVKWQKFFKMFLAGMIGFSPNLNHTDLSKNC